MSVVRELVRHTVVQALADRLWLAVPGYALACVVGVPLASHLALGAGSRAAWEVGLTLQWALVSLAGGWLGLRSMGLDLEHRTASVFLSGPVGLGQWLAGRAVGVALILGVLSAALQGVWLAICLWRGLSPSLDLLSMGVALWLEGSVVAAITALLSTRANALVASGASAGVFVAGHLSSEYTGLIEEWGAPAVSIAIYSLIPDLDLFDLQTPLVTQTPIEPERVLVLLGYALLWLGVLTALTALSLQTRDLA